jgi:hypothetical protein
MWEHTGELSLRKAEICGMRMYLLLLLLALAASLPGTLQVAM